MAEFGRYPLYISALKLSVGYWHHIITSQGNKLIKSAYAASQYTNNGFKNYIKILLQRIGFSHVWENQCTFSKRALLKAIMNKLNDRYILAWKKDLAENNQEHGNKLRTYKILKNSYKIENYLFLDVDKTHITNFAKLRISNSKLMIEQGRYKKLEVKDRLCPLCMKTVEDEFHFVINCSHFQKSRTELFQQLKNVIPYFSNMTNENKFLLILGSNDIDISKICVTGISMMYIERLNLGL